MTTNRRPSRQTNDVLEYFMQDPDAERYGLEVAHGVGLKSGSVYPILARLEGRGMLTSRREAVDPSEAGRPARRYYMLTGEGARAAHQARHEQRQRGARGVWRPAPAAAH